MLLPGLEDTEGIGLFAVGVRSRLVREKISEKPEPPPPPVDGSIK